MKMTTNEMQKWPVLDFQRNQQEETTHVPAGEARRREMYVRRETSSCTVLC